MTRPQRLSRKQAANWPVVGGIAVPPGFAPASRKPNLTATTYLTHSQITGREATTQAIIGLLRRLSLSRVLPLTKVMTDFTFDVTEYLDQRFHDWLSKLYLPADLYREVRRYWQKNEFRPVFILQSAWLITKLALIASKSTQRNPKPDKCNLIYGEALFRANDIVNTHVADGTDNVRAMLAFAYNHLAATHPATVLGRSRLLWSYVFEDVRIVAGETGSTIELNRGRGVPLAMAALHFLAMWFMPQKGKPHNVKVRGQTAFNKTNLDRASLRATMDFVAGRPIDLSMKLLELSQHSWTRDTSLLTQYPLVRIGKVDYCYDIRMFHNFLNGGLYWRVRDGLPAADRETLTDLMTKSFNEYVVDRFSDVFPMSGSLTKQLHRSPHFRGNSDEVSDLVITTKKALFLVESKASLLTPHAKYSSQGGALEGDLMRRFIKGDTRAPKGLAQLAKSCSRIAKGEQVGIAGYDARQVRQIVPVLVALEELVAAPFVVPMMVAEFKTQLAQSEPGRIEILSPVILGIHDIENLAAYSQLLAFEDLFLGYARTVESSALPFERYAAGACPRAKFNDGVVSATGREMVQKEFPSMMKNTHAKAGQR